VRELFCILAKENKHTGYRMHPRVLVVVLVVDSRLLVNCGSVK